MNYVEIYKKLIDKCKSSQYDGQYTETHHIIPKCIGGTNDSENLVVMSAREHFVAHQLLYKIYKDKKLLYAINMMTLHNSQNRNTNRLYSWLRENFSENHPCKDDMVKTKISESLKLYFSSDLHRNKMEKRYWKYRERRICACGCGTEFVCYKKDKKIYFNSKHTPPPDYSKVSETIKKTLSKLSSEEMRQRSLNSLLMCDHVQRGKKISISKKGKTTNQQEIMGKRYASMSDDEFVKFLGTKKEIMWNRIKNLRNSYK